MAVLENGSARQSSDIQPLQEGDKGKNVLHDLTAINKVISPLMAIKNDPEATLTQEQEQRLTNLQSQKAQKFIEMLVLKRSGVFSDVVETFLSVGVGEVVTPHSQNLASAKFIYSDRLEIIRTALTEITATGMVSNSHEAIDLLGEYQPTPEPEIDFLTRSCAELYYLSEEHTALKNKPHKRRSDNRRISQLQHFIMHILVDRIMSRRMYFSMPSGAEITLNNVRHPRLLKIIHNLYGDSFDITLIHPERFYDDDLVRKFLETLEDMGGYDRRFDTLDEYISFRRASSPQTEQSQG